MKPDFIVVAVDRDHSFSVARQWLDRGFAVLAETPLTTDSEELEEIEKYKDHKLVVAEQYHCQPLNSARIKLLQKKLIGEPSYLYFSLAHGPHAGSLIRRFLNVSCKTAYTIAAADHSLPLCRTRSRYEDFTDGLIENSVRTLARIVFESGQVVNYDFSSSQYRSLILNSSYRVQGSHGELFNDEVLYIDDKQKIRREKLLISSHQVRKESENPNLKEYREIDSIVLGDEVLYQAPFGKRGLSEDETAVAIMLKQMGEYVKGEGKAPYLLEEALWDTAFYLNLLKESGKTKI